MSIFAMFYLYLIIVATSAMLISLFLKSRFIKRQIIISKVGQCIVVLKHLPGEDKKLSSIRNIYKLLKSLQAFDSRCGLEMFLMDLDSLMSKGGYNSFMDTNYIDLHYELHQPLIELRELVLQYKEIM